MSDAAQQAATAQPSQAEPAAPADAPADAAASEAVNAAVDGQAVPATDAVQPDARAEAGSEADSGADSGAEQNPDAAEGDAEAKADSPVKSAGKMLKETLDPEIRNELLREYCSSHRETSVFVPLLAMVIPYVTSAWLPEWHFIVWFLVGLVFVGVSWMSYSAFIKAKDEGRITEGNIKNWILMIGAPRTLFMAFLAGIVVWSIFAKAPTEFFMAYVFIMAVMSVNSASSGLYLPLLYAELAPMVLLLLAGMAMPGANPTATSWAGAMLIYTLFVVRMGMAVHSSSKSTFEQKRDILTAKDAAEDARYAAEEANHAKSAFLATMSHEVRTPMNGILGMVNLLRDTNLDKQQRDYTETIHYSGEALLTILNDILDFSKLEAGKLDFEMMDFDMKRLLESVRSLMQSRASERGDIIELIAPDHLPRFLRSDPTRLRQVLLNLISNAVKFTENGVVTLEVEIMPSDDRKLWLRFNVRDTGIGIPEEARAKLFQKFSQIDSSISRRYGGTGLGLAICKQIVEQMNGQIGVESEKGEGSNFWFEMPFAEARDIHLEEDEGMDLKQEVEVRMSPKHILLAEDNIVNQKVALGLLRKHGHHVTLVVNGREAVEAAQKQQYDLVLMDMQMPEMDGLEATKQIRAMGGYYADLPIIALTANAMRGDDERCFAAGMNAHVGKPVNPFELYETMAKLIEPSALKELPEEDTVIPQDIEEPGAEHVQQIEIPDDEPAQAHMQAHVQEVTQDQPAAHDVQPEAAPREQRAAEVPAQPEAAPPEQPAAEVPVQPEAAPVHAEPDQPEAVQPDLPMAEPADPTMDDIAPDLPPDLPPVQPAVQPQSPGAVQAATPMAEPADPTDDDITQRPEAETPAQPEMAQPEQPEQPPQAEAAPPQPDAPAPAPDKPADNAPPEKMNGSPAPDVVPPVTPEQGAMQQPQMEQQPEQPQTEKLPEQTPQQQQLQPEPVQPEPVQQDPVQQPIRADVPQQPAEPAPAAEEQPAEQPAAAPQAAAAIDPIALLGYDQSRVNQMEQSLGKEFMVGFLAESVPEIVKMLDNLDNASAGYYDAMTARQIAHDLKALAGQLGMEGLHGYLERIEMCYAEDRGEEAGAMCAPVRPAFTAGLNKLRETYPAAFTGLGDDMRAKQAETAGQAG